MERLVAELQDAAAYQRFRLIEAMAKLQGIQPYMVAARSLGHEELRNGIIAELSHLSETAVEKLQSLATEVLLQLVSQISLLRVKPHFLMICVFRPTVFSDHHFFRDARDCDLLDPDDPVAAFVLGVV